MTLLTRTGLAAFAILTLLAIFAVNRSDAADPALDSLATTIVGYPVTVTCFPHSDDGPYAGYVYLDHPGEINLDGALCGALLNVLHPGPRTARWLRSFDAQQDVGYAYLALTHEATHLIEYRDQGAIVANDEGLTECTAIRNIYPRLALLHLPPRVRSGVYTAALNTHKSYPTTGINSVYRSVC